MGDGINNFLIIENTKMGGVKRQSNIEALRLLSMLMVLNLHSFSGYDHNHDSELFQVIDFFRECTSICAVNAFLIISGYFRIKWKLNSLFNLVFQLFFYAFVVYGVAVLIGILDFTIIGFLKCATCLFTHWGFITYYLVLYLVAPLLNSFIKSVTSRELLGYIIILIVCENLFTRNYAFLNYCTMYLIGGYISVSGLIKNTHLLPGRLYWITTSLIFIFVWTSYKYLHIVDPAKMLILPWGLDYAAPLVILQAVFLFVWFARLQIQSKIINWCAVSCLSIFLIHMHPSIKQTGYYDFTESLYSLSLFDHIWKLVCLMCIVFFGSIMIDKIRIMISSYCYKFFLWVIARTKISDTKVLTYIPILDK